MWWLARFTFIMLLSCTYCIGDYFEQLEQMLKSEKAQQAASDLHSAFATDKPKEIEIICQSVSLYLSLSIYLSIFFFFCFFMFQCEIISLYIIYYPNTNAYLFHLHRFIYLSISLSFQRFYVVDACGANPRLNGYG